jgi:predicted aspartyl protease
MASSRAEVAAIAAAFVIAALVPLTAEALTDDASAVLAKHASYVGQPQGVVLTYRYKATPKTTPAPTPTPKVDEPTFPPPSVTTYRRGALYRQVSEFGGVTEQEGFTGRAFWSANFNGYTVLNYEDAARQLLTANLIEGDLLANVPASSRGAQTIDGVAVDVVRITPENGIPAEIAFDRATGGYVQVKYNPDDPHRHATVHYGGYTEVAPGVRVPSRFHTSESGHWALTEKAMRVVTAEDLRGPVPTAKWNFTSTEPAPIEVKKYQQVYGFAPGGGAVYVKASIDGHVGNFLLDSGASSVVLYHPYADKLKLTMLGRTGISGIAGRSVRARFARVTSIDVGKNSLSNVIVVVAGNEFSREIDGILGFDFLAGALVDVDTANQTIRLLDVEKMQPTIAKGAYAFPVNLSGLVPSVPLKVNGLVTHPILDTGNSSFLTLSEELKTSGKIVALTDTVRVNNRQVEYAFTFYGIDGPVQYPEKCSRLLEVEIGPYRYQNVETCFASANVFGRDDGLVGFDFLKHFNWTFDYAESKLVLTPNGK